MHRRDFLAASAATFVTTRLDLLPRASRHTQGRPARLGPEIFRARRQRAQEEMARRDLDLLLATPSVNFQYLVGYNPGRSERLIALLLPRTGDAVVVAPSFEVERVRRGGTIQDVRGWEEQEDPFALVARTVSAWRGPRVGVEPSTEYQTVLRLADALVGRRLENGGPVFERLRIIKQPEELTLIRAAIRITEDAIAATFAALTAGVTDREVATMISREMSQRGASGGGLVQFGPTSALPHGGTENRSLAPNMPVLIDVGCRVEGYTSDITRTQWFGDARPERFVQVYNTVYDAQTAAMTLGRPGVPCQEMDRAARLVIREAGFGEYFTHRLGHGMGMDGHEPPYLVQGNALALEPGMVVTVEPGIYLPNEWGVRIEDDCVVTADGFEVMSRRPAKL
ncbi:MAG: aminopeptidase P family protein [Gemmatimonadetes bacterium]|nr:aminopeptidase P family protein [Gemmatimonadota bacterium]